MTRRYIDFVKYRGSSVDFPVVAFGDVRIGNNNDGDDAVLDVVDASTTVPSILLLLVLASMSFLFVCLFVCLFVFAVKFLLSNILEDD
jgi:ABC-type proline/glycine betaine transport system permease subunit